MMIWYFATIIYFLLSWQISLFFSPQDLSLLPIYLRLTFFLCLPPRVWRCPQNNLHWDVPFLYSHNTVEAGRGSYNFYGCAHIHYCLFIVDIRSTHDLWLYLLCFYYFCCAFLLRQHISHCISQTYPAEKRINKQQKWKYFSNPSTLFLPSSNANLIIFTVLITKIGFSVVHFFNPSK